MWYMALKSVKQKLTYLNFPEKESFHVVYHFPLFNRLIILIFLSGEEKWVKFNCSNGKYYIPLRIFILKNHFYSEF